MIVVSTSMVDIDGCGNVVYVISRERVERAKMRRTLVVSCLMVGSLSSGAVGDVVTFDDLGASPGGTLMPPSYGGLDWGNSAWHFMTSASGNNFLALSAPSTLVRSESLTDFVFEGADFWSRRGLDGNGDFYFVLYLDGATVYNGLLDPDGRQRFDGTSRFFVPNYAGLVDAFAIAFDNDDHDHLAMDNLRVKGVPTPGGVTLGMVLAVVGLRRRRSS